MKREETRQCGTGPMTDPPMDETELRLEKETHLSIYFQHECQAHSTGKEQSFQQMVLGQLDSYIQKNEVQPSHHI